MRNVYGIPVYVSMEEGEMKPNNRLKQEREQRGWSQAKLAELVGTNPATVGRWERGISSPYPIHRERLCLLFDKDVRELGLIEDDEVPQEQTDGTASDSLSPALAVTQQQFIFDPAIPMLPAETSTLVGRDDLLAKLKQQLFTGEAPGLNALSGLPGVGKTTLALALVHDREIQAHFSGGILWAGLGIKPDVQEIQSHWGTVLGLSPVEMTDIKSRDDWAKTLRALIGMRRMLLIIDDVWEIDDALAFQVGGPPSMYLITTRFPQIAIQIAGSRTVSVSELSEDDGVELLAHFVPKPIEQDDTTARQLVHSVGALPLALVLMGRYLRSHAYNEQPRRLHNALQYLSNAEKRLHLSEPSGLSRPHSGYSLSTRHSLQSVIALSGGQLALSAQTMLRALAVFPPKPNTFSEDAAVAISEQTAETLDALCDAGLLESSAPERYMIHQTIADYAREQMAEHAETLYWRMITYVNQYIKMHEADYKALEQEHANILVALEEAVSRGMDSEFVQGVTAFAPFLRIRGLYDEAIQYLRRAYPIAQNLDDRFEEMEILSHLGQISELLSEYKQAEGYLSEGLRLARQDEQGNYVCLFLAHLGAVMDKLGEYGRAETYLQEGLSLARQLDQPERICQVLIVLGRMMVSQGNYTRAEPILSEALQLARQLEHKEYMIRSLTQFGILIISKEDYALSRIYFLEVLDLAYQMGYRDRIIRAIINLSGALGSAGDYEQAEHYLQEGLRLAQQIGNRENMGMLLNNLGSLAGLQGHYEQARTYLHEGLSVLRQINHPRLINHILYEQGEVALSSQQYDEARTAFNEVLTQAAAFPEIRANAHYGMARTMALQGNIVEAHQHGKISVEIFEDLGLPKAATVRNWLATLPRPSSERYSHQIH